MKVNVSIVLYKNSVNHLRKLILELLKSSLIKDIFLIDNSSTNELQRLQKLDKVRIKYLFNAGLNLGFSKAHNTALKKSMQQKIDYHIILNPDVFFEETILIKLYEFMEENLNIGLLMPKVLYPDGSLQFLCKLLPTPFDLFGRRFLNFYPFSQYIEKRNEIYELRFTGYDKIMEVPFLSGCFMFLRVDVLKKVGLFDERFFMYFEDTDLSRRIYRVAKTIYYPYVQIYHGYEKGSYKNLRLLKIHIESAIKYFNKWGWFNDPERDRINRETLEKLGYKGGY